MRDIPLIPAKGSPATCGESVGRALRADIHANIADYRAIFLHMAGADAATVRRFAQTLVPAIEAYAPEQIEEMQGLARGADAEFADILALNARTEIMYGLAAEKSRGFSECTSLGILPELTRSGHTLIGQNWDWKESVAGRTVLLALEQPGRPRTLVFTEAGFVGKIGLNEAGIGVCANLLGSAHDRGQPGVPFHVILRKILAGTNMHRAIQAVTAPPRGSSGNYLIGARGGEVVDLEATPEALGWVLPQDGILAHANHFLAPELQRHDTHIKASTMTVVRCDRARRLIAQDRGRIDNESFVRVLRDHFSFPHAICRHADTTQPEIERTISGASIIMDLDESKMLVAAGPPCEHEYREHRIG